MEVFRIADGRRPVFDGTGSFLYGNRWNSQGRKIIYAAQTYAGALLETLVHAELGRVPRNQVWVSIQIPENVSIEIVPPDRVPGWPSSQLGPTQKIGDSWFDEQRSAVLRVPSVVTSGVESNFLLNQNHPQFASIRVSRPQPVAWDPRLLAGR
ncbi:MAG: RES family NAD+ phosphorylase [Bryobacteraceae bacterium]